MTTIPIDDRAARPHPFCSGYTARPGVNPGQPFQPGAITGGMAGPTIVVHTLDELRAALDLPGPAWIIASPTAGGHLTDRLWIRTSNKTLIAPDGIILRNRGLRIDRAMNVAIYGLTVQGVQGDAIEISESRVVAVAGCRVSGWTDGGIDIVRGSTDVLISGCRVEGGGKAKKGMLICADDTPYQVTIPGALGRLDDRQTRVTLENNTFIGVQARCPLVRHGRVTLRNHHIAGGGKSGLVEARTGARVLWESGRVSQHSGRPVIAATYRGQDAVTAGFLYVAPGVDLGGATAQANWAPTAREILEATA